MLAAAALFGAKFLMRQQIGCGRIQVRLGAKPWAVGQRQSAASHAREGLGKSMFAGLIPRTLTVPGPARTWRSVRALLEMAVQAGEK